MKLSDNLEEEFLAMERGEKPKDIVKPMLWSAENSITVQKMCGLAPCSPREKQTFQYYFLKSKKYDLLFSLILNSAGGSFNFEEDLRDYLKAVGYTRPPDDSIESLEWCIVNEDLISTLFRRGTVKEKEWNEIKEYLKKQERYDLLFLCMKLDTLTKQEE